MAFTSTLLTVDQSLRTRYTVTYCVKFVEQKLQITSIDQKAHATLSGIATVAKATHCHIPLSPLRILGC